MPAHKSRVREKYKAVGIFIPIDDEDFVRSELNMTLAEFGRRAWTIAMQNLELLGDADEAEQEFQDLTTHNGSSKRVKRQFEQNNDPTP